MPGRLVDNFMEWSVCCTMVKLCRARCEGRAPLGVGGASAAESVAYGCSGLNMFGEENAGDHRGKVGGLEDFCQIPC